LNLVFSWMDNAPRRAFGMVALACVAMLVFGLYLQHVVGLEPCPMCIVQRYALILVAACAALTAASSRKGVHVTGGVLLVVLAVAGAYVAARQSWLQWYPPEVVSCGRDLYGMIETFPLKRALPMIFGAAAIAARWIGLFSAGVSPTGPSFASAVLRYSAA